MTKSDWISMATAVITIGTMLVSPVWGWWIIKRITQPKPNPPENTAANRPNWIRRLVETTWFMPGIVIVLSIYQLHRDVHSTAPLDRRAVMQMAIDVTLLCFGLGGMTVFTIMSNLRDIQNSLPEKKVCSKEPRK